MFNRCKILWYPLRAKSRIPTKRDEDAGFDIYTTENKVWVRAHGQILFPTGIAAAVSKGYWLEVKDRGSTGSKGLHVHCGVIDNGYRDEIFVCIKNDNAYDVVFTDEEKEGWHNTSNTTGYLVYPVKKAIAQIIPIRQPRCKSKEASKREWAKLRKTKRGMGKLGSTGK